MTDLNNFFYTDGVHDVLAAYVNQLVAGNLRGELSNIETLTANKTLTNANFPIQSVAASGADRDVILPAVAAANHGFMIINRAATLYSINVKNAGGTIIYTLRPGAAAFFASDGTNDWYSSTGLSRSGGVLTGVLDAVQLDVRRLAAQTSDLARFGDGTTHYLAIEADGALRAVGNATWFDDLRIEPVARTTGTKAPTFEVYQTDGAGSVGVWAYSFDNAVLANQKEVFFTMQMPHAKKMDSVIHLHVHWVPKTAGTAGHKVKWGLEYSWQKLGSAFGTTTIIYADTTVSGNIATALSHSLTEFADITPPASETVSSILWGRLFRFSSDAGDTATITAGLISIDAHVEMDTLGSRTEFTK